MSGTGPVSDHSLGMQVRLTPSTACGDSGLATPVLMRRDESDVRIGSHVAD